ncbi:MAG: hypothetical protein IJY15_13650, partial [Thermoguttaceae bacterium]|nr:hypothetical protein [Thermoguttaceae bacterium]
LAKLRTADEISVLRAEERSVENVQDASAPENVQNASESEGETKDKDRENAAVNGGGANAENGNDAAETER